jgi:hypothetical protein
LSRAHCSQPDDAHHSATSGPLAKPRILTSWLTALHMPILCHSACWRQVAVDQAEHGEDPEHVQRLAPIDHVFALGDCCARMDLALPALAQVRGVPPSLLGRGASKCDASRPGRPQFQPACTCILWCLLRWRNRDAQSGVGTRGMNRSNMVDLQPS